MILLSVLLGVVVVVVLSAATGYFVAQEFGYMVVDRSRLKSCAAAGDAGAQRALAITARTSFMLSGAQLGITVTGLLVGYLAEPLIGAGIGAMLGGAGVPTTVGITVGTTLALLLSTVVQMLFGELVPKNLAIARPEQVARRLAWSTRLYLALFGWLIYLFDQASNLLLRALQIEPVHDVEHSATPRDLRRIVAASKSSGDLPAELSALLDRILDLDHRTAGHAMIPRPQVATVGAGALAREVLDLMAAGHSRYPVIGADIDDVVGEVDLRDLLDVPESKLNLVTVGEIARKPVLVPESLSLNMVQARLRRAGRQMAVVIDEYGGLAGVITSEDIAEEMVGEIADEHDTSNGEAVVPLDASSWRMPGAMHLDEVERLIDHRLPPAHSETIGGLIIDALGRIPRPGDTVVVALPIIPGVEDSGSNREAILTVATVRRRVPETVELRLRVGTDRQVSGR